MLATGTNVPIRQRTSRATIDWSYQLLEPAMQTLFSRVAASPVAAHYAEAVCNPSGELGLETIDGVDLVDQSLLRQKTDDGESRFGMLETIREYGRDRWKRWRRRSDRPPPPALLQSPRANGRASFPGSDQARWLDRFEREHDNVRVALGRAVDDHYVDDGLQLAAAPLAILVPAWLSTRGPSLVAAIACNATRCCPQW